MEKTKAEDDMNEYLMLRLHGVMQSWGGHTYEDYRPSLLFPTRSSLEGLLGACLGIDRDDSKNQKALSTNFSYAVRTDEAPYPVRKITDFHTVMEARKVDGSSNKNPVVSRREYLCDASFTVALRFNENASFARNDIIKALQKPVYTPFLGRRSCPLSVPLYHSVLLATSFIEALFKVEPFRGTIYSEEAYGSPNRLIVRDVPIFDGKRQFAARSVYIHAPGGDNVYK